MSGLLRTVLVMSLSGTVAAVLLFALKPLIRNRLPRAAQYYLWLIVIAALLVPESAFVKLPETAPVIPAPSSMIQRYVITSEEEMTALNHSLPMYSEDSHAQYMQTVEQNTSPIAAAVSVFTLIYPLGALIALGYYLVNYAVFIRLYRRRNTGAQAAELCVLAELCGDRRVPLYRNPHAATPMLLGFPRPMIILPDREYTHEQLRAVLLHELTHLRRMDMTVKWLTVLACCIHWFNPIVWRVRREIDRACELSCDEAVVRSLDAKGRQSYGETLIHVAADAGMPKAVLSTTMCEEKSALKERLGAIIKSKRHTRAAIIMSAVLAVMVCGMAVAIGAGRVTQGTAALPEHSVIPTAEPEHAAADEITPDVEPEGTAADDIMPDTGSVSSAEPGTAADDYTAIQQSVADGTETWRLDPEEVALRYATDVLSLQGTVALYRNDGAEYARVVFTKQTGAEIHIDLYQPAKKGDGGIWAVDYWFDENSRMYQVRNLRAFPPLFHNDENVPYPVREAVRNAVVTEWTEVFSRHYQVLGFYAENVEYSVTGGEAELKFIMTLVTQNFYKDPDTVGYIMEAKEKGSPYYQQIYEEYNMPRSGTIDMKVTMSLTGTGEVVPDSIRIYSNISPHGEEYVPTKAEDFIISGN